MEGDSLRIFHNIANFFHELLILKFDLKIYKFVPHIERSDDEESLGTQQILSLLRGRFMYLVTVVFLF